MIYLACDTCRKRVGCKLFEAQARLSLFAWGRDESAPECEEWAAKWERGVEGVFDYHRPSPRPFRFSRRQECHHGRSS